MLAFLHPRLLEFLSSSLGAAVERRTINSGSNTTVLARLSPRKRPRSNSAAFCPMASVGCDTTVNGGSEYWAQRASSKPTSERSRGTFTPLLAGSRRVRRPSFRYWRPGWRSGEQGGIKAVRQRFVRTVRGNRRTRCTRSEQQSVPTEVFCGKHRAFCGRWTSVLVRKSWQLVGVPVRLNGGLRVPHPVGCPE